DRFQQPRPEGLVNLDCRAKDLFGAVSSRMIASARRTLVFKTGKIRKRTGRRKGGRWLGGKPEQSWLVCFPVASSSSGGCAQTGAAWKEWEDSPSCLPPLFSSRPARPRPPERAGRARAARLRGQLVRTLLCFLSSCRNLRTSSPSALRAS